MEVCAGDGEDGAGHQTRPGQDRGQPRHRQTGETIFGQPPGPPGSCTGVQLSKSIVILAHCWTWTGPASTTACGWEDTGPELTSSQRDPDQLSRCYRCLSQTFYTTTPHAKIITQLILAFLSKIKNI